MSGKMLGKRQRSQGTMHRTTSMASVPAAAKHGRPPCGGRATTGRRPPPCSLEEAPATAAAADHGGVETAAFLKKLRPVRPRPRPWQGHLHLQRWVARGEVAFCSKECRECVIEYYERKERNCSLTSIKDTPAVSGASGSDQSGASGSETVAAA
ncbi:hypothetical protein OsJ_08403 [Oryza sativa Japonica Group]|uniref:FLZ-type domain-containing protein n=1 Tax=Oryza sativa subsp. japonica TaxID=39947 RepID=B9F307_ORYSJ|nr:hypothetical protein OsJ_08403 [Oryza sativa Japonica Group]